MASDAYEKLAKRMDAAKEAEIAAYIMRDIELRQQNAQANRKAAEDEMWEQWNRSKEKQERHPRGSKRHRKEDEDAVVHKRRKRSPSEDSDISARSGRSETSTDSDSERGSPPPSVQELRSRTAVRGRGATGSRADDTGPFLFPTDEEERKEDELVRFAQKNAAGPECPLWIRATNAVEASRKEKRASGSHDKALLVKKKERAKKARKEQKRAKKLKREKQKRKERA